MADGLLNKASIILTPTGYKAGTLYNVAPVVEPYEDFDFARASVASRVNSSGLVEMVGRTLSSELITDGSFPDGTTAWTFSNPGGTHGWRIADGKAICDTNAATANRNLSSSLSLDSSKDYKLTIDILQSADNITVYVGGTALSPKLPTSEILGYEYYISSSDHSGGVLMFYAGSSDLQEIDNVSVKEIIDTNNIPRISYDSNGDNGHILLEPTSTNFLPYSNDFSQSNWVKQTNITATYNTTETLSPDGTYNATKLVGDGTDGIFDSSLSITGDVTRSVYLKSVSGTVTLKLKDSNINIGIETLTVTTEWQRFYLSGDNGSSLQGIFIFNIPSSGVYMWGAQVENSPYPTSYIPTLTGSTVTRATETANGAGSATLINSTEGVLYAEIAALADDGTYRFISINDGTFNNSVTIRFDNTSNTIIAISRLSSVNQASLSYSFSTIQFYKIAFKYKANDFALWINGVEVATDTSGLTFSSNTLTQLDFNRGDGSFPFYGKCKALAVFNEALSDSELTQLTT